MTRLADQIVERARAVTGHPMDPDWQEWASRLQRATCYVVEESAGRLSFGTTEASPLRAATRTRTVTAVPHALTWFEWAGASAALGPRGGEPLRAGTVIPNRCGVLIEAPGTDRRHGFMSWVWRMPDDTLEACPLSISFDWRLEPSPVPDMIRAAFALQGQSWRDYVKAIHDKSRFAAQPFDPMLHEEQRYGHVPCHILKVFWTGMATLMFTQTEVAQEIIQAALRDVEHEPIFVLGLLICLCADGIFDVSEPPDLERLNLSRRKRGRPALLPFSTISASGKNVIRLTDRGGSLETLVAMHTA